MKDINFKSLGLGLKSAKKVYDDAVKKRKIKQPYAVYGMGLISPTLDYSGFENADLIVEKLDSKPGTIAQTPNSEVYKYFERLE